MSSMRNAVQRRNHKERAQPLERGRLGLLEKKKDYSARAKDYNKKKQQLKNLRDKAAERNEDEFYFGMMSRKGPKTRLASGTRRWDGTVEGDRGNTVLDMDTVRLLKTQDMGYVRTMKQVVAKEVARLEQQLVMTRGLDNLDDGDEEDDDMDFDSDDEPMPRFSKPKAPRKINFVDTEEDRQLVVEEAEEQEIEAEEEGETKRDADAKRQKSVNGLKKQMENAKRKLKVLTDAEQALDVQKAKMAKDGNFIWHVEARQENDRARKKAISSSKS